MRILRGKYSKEDGSSRDIAVYVMKNGDIVEGIDTTYLNDEEKLNLKTIVDDFYSKLEPFKKAYRKFKLFSITDFEDINI